jgi:hypothetical protein
MRGIRTVVIAALFLFGVLVVATTGPAKSVTGVGVVTGSGTISPGLTSFPTDQSLTFSTLAAFGASSNPTNAGSYACTFNGGSSAPETTQQGAGTGAGSCGGALSVGCSFSYTRVGAIFTWKGDCGGSSLDAEFVFIATSTQPTTSYLLFGPMWLVDVSPPTTTTLPPPATTSTTLPSVTTSIPTPPTTIPSIGGGSAGPSGTCSSNLIFDGGAENAHVKILEQEPDSSRVWLCVRAEVSGQGYGGQVEVVLPTPSGGGAAPPTTDMTSNACWTTAGNTVPGSHPAVKVDAPAHLYIDTYNSGSDTWLCVEAGGVTPGSS